MTCRGKQVLTTTKAALRFSYTKALTMNWIFIRGPKALFPSLLGIDGLVMDHSGIEDLDDEQRISAEATDAAITAIEATGLIVQVDKTEAQLAQYVAAVLNGEDPDSGVA